MRIRFLALAGGLAISGCSSPPVIYGAHSYSCCDEITFNHTGHNLTWHTGQSLTLHWRPTPPGRTTDPTRHQIVLSLSLTGPFANVDALKQAISQGSKPAGVRTISAAPVSANDKTVEAPASQLYLPSDLPPGYYNLTTQASEAGQSWGGDAVVIVVP